MIYEYSQNQKRKYLNKLNNFDNYDELSSKMRSLKTTDMETNPKYNLEFPGNKKYLKQKQGNRVQRQNKEIKTNL